MTNLLPNPFIDPDRRFNLDEDALAAAIDPDDLPAFIVSPSPEYLAATEIEPILKMIFQRSAA